MPNIRHKLPVEAPIGAVFKAITEHEGLAGWWTPTNTGRPELGAIINFDFGDRYHNEMKIIRLEPNECVEWICLKGDPEWVDTHFMFELEKAGENSTIVRFGQTGWREETDFYANCNYLWGHYMTSLKSYCETGKGMPFEE